MQAIGRTIRPFLRRLAYAVLAVLALAASPAAADGTHIALVIGNASYETLPQLANPANDARAVANALRSIGYTVEVQTDIGLVQMQNVLSNFAQRASGADAAIIYFAGYGVAAGAVNTLAPIDANSASSTVAVSELYFCIAPARGLKLVILDASRSNPFGGAGGLLTQTATVAGLVVLSAAQPGTVAGDGPFTNALLKELPSLGTDASAFANRVRADVRAATASDQDPSVAFGSSTEGPHEAQYNGVGGGDAGTEEERDNGMWNAIAANADASQLQTYLQYHPNGLHAAEARARLAGTGAYGRPYDPHPHVVDPYAGLPSFPWPPPPPSEKMVLPRDKLLAGLGAKPSLGAIGQKLTKTLVSAGYPEYSFYRVPDGFAIVARLEQITADGSPQPQGERFLDPDAQAEFSLKAYLAHLFYAPQGFYRLIVFVVTPQAVMPRGPAPKAEKMQSLLANGATKLPSAYNNQTFTADHDVTALIYEFRKSGATGVLALTPGRLDARTHLQKAGLYDRLMNGGR